MPGETEAWGAPQRGGEARPAVVVTVDNTPEKGPQRRKTGADDANVSFQAGPGNGVDFGVCLKSKVSMLRKRCGH